MLGTILCFVYFLAFTFIIFKAPFFTLLGLKKVHTLLAFLLKLVFGAVLWYIYAYYYKSRLTSDIFKYFDDGKLIYITFHTNPGTFFKMLTGINDNSPAIQGYYHAMNSWINDHDSSLYNNSHLIVRLNAVLMFISNGNYFVHVLVMCFISLIGLVYLYKAFYPYLTDKALGLFAAIFLFPSVLLWGSGILKEGLVFLGLGLTIYHFMSLLKKQGKVVLNVLLFVLGIVLLFESKAYVLLCLAPCLISELLISKIKSSGRHPWITYILVSVIYLGIGLNADMFVPRLNPLKMMADKQRDLNRMVKGGIYLLLIGTQDSNVCVRLDVKDSANIIPADNYADSIYHLGGILFIASPVFCYLEESENRVAPFRIKEHTPYELINLSRNDTLRLMSDGASLYKVDLYCEPAKSKVYIAPIEPTILGLIKHVPMALTIALLKPFPWEKISSPMVLIYLAENIVIVLIVLLALIMFKRPEHQNMVAFCLTYSLIMLVLIGLTTPLYGGIERYKSVVIPFMLILLLLIYDKDKLKRIFKRN